MGFLIKTVFFGILASLCIAYYGDDIVRLIQNQARLAQNSAPKEIANNSINMHSVQIPMQQDGHYWLNANIRGHDVRFVVDTGASYITFSYDDAKKLGIPLFESDFNVPANTAGGKTTMAVIELDVFNVDTIELYNIKAFVARKDMLDVSLLGMNFLNRMERFEFSNQKLIIEH